MFCWYTVVNGWLTGFTTGVTATGVGWVTTGGGVNAAGDGNDVCAGGVKPVCGCW